VGLPPAVAALIFGVGPCWGETCGDLLEAMARIAPSQPNEAMARIASRRNRIISLDPNLSAFNFRVGFNYRAEEDLARNGVRLHHQPLVSHQIAQFDVHSSSDFAYPPCSAASFDVNSEPHTGARPSVRLFVGLMTRRISSVRVCVKVLQSFSSRASVSTKRATWGRLSRKSHSGNVKIKTLPRISVSGTSLSVCVCDLVVNGPLDLAARAV
jgi:hypothetical protein